MLELTLHFNKQAFAPGEPVTGKITLRNSGQSPVKVNGRLALNAPFSPDEFREIALALNDPAGAPLDFQAKVNIGAPKDSHFKTLLPGEAVERSYNLSDYYVVERPGNYSAQATYQNQSEPETANGIGAWKGELVSPVARFTVQA